MLSVAECAGALKPLFTTEADRIAAETGFVKRQRLLTGATFAQTLVFGWLQNPRASLERLADSVGASRQALHQRLTAPAIAFLAQLLAHALQLVWNTVPAVVPLLQRFNGIYAEDCTSVTLSDACAADFPGCGGSTAADGKAALKIYTRYELCSGAITELAFQPGRSPDVLAGQTYAVLPAGSLRLADLGFFDLDVLAAYTEQGVFWINRLPAHATVATAAEAPIGIATFLAGQKGDRLDLAVTVGSNKELPCRLLAWRCPATVTQRRRDKLAKSARKKGSKVSWRQWQLAAWTVFVTNLAPERLSAAEAWELYRARWQIELLFKRWKSQGRLAETAGKSRERVLCELLAKLLGQVVANWAILLRGGPLSENSMTKAMQVVQEWAGLVRRTLGAESLLEIVLTQLAEALGRLRPSKRKRRTTRERLLKPSLTN